MLPFYCVYDGVFNGKIRSIINFENMKYLKNVPLF